MGNYSSSQLCPNPECGLYIPHPVGSCARLKQEQENAQASSGFRHPYPRRPHSSYIQEEVSQSACASPSIVTRESVHHHAIAGTLHSLAIGSSSVTSSPYRFRPGPASAYPGRQPGFNGEAVVEPSSEFVEGESGPECPVSPEEFPRDPGSSSYVNYHSTQGRSICSPRRGIRPSGSTHSLFEDAVTVCRKDEEEIAEANEKRGIVTRGEYFSSSRYSSRRSSAVTTPGEPEEGFCRLGASPRRTFRPANQRSLDGCDIFAAIQALNELKEAGEVDQVHEWVNEQGRLQRRLKKARPGIGIVGPSGEEFCGLATVEEAKLVEGGDSSTALDKLVDEKEHLLSTGLTPLDSSSGEVSPPDDSTASDDEQPTITERPAGLETDDIGVVFPPDEQTSRSNIHADTSTPLCHNDTDTTLVEADHSRTPLEDQLRGVEPPLFSVGSGGSSNSDEEPMDCMDSLAMEIRPGEEGVVDLSEKDEPEGNLPPRYNSQTPYHQHPGHLFAEENFLQNQSQPFPHSVAEACGNSNDDGSPLMDTSTSSARHHSPGMLS